ncbi:MAG: hypothetical protein J2P28_08015 [Actinobacteria bacterium]|nr:hypothetical protein [Actinomycetota bacterium]MBO0835450.1 hypothetical protein [Actinomycetota bacterium]
MPDAAVGPATARPNVIRRPLAVRVFQVFFPSILCCGVLAYLILAAVDGSPAVVIPLVMLAIGLTICYRVFRLSVALRPQDLLVRNYFRTRRIARADIAGFCQGAVGHRPFTRMIYVLLRDRTVLSLDTTARPCLFGLGATLLEDRMQLLQRWLEQP